MVSHRTSRAARELMRQNPGLRYQIALAQVRSQTPTGPTYSTPFDPFDIEKMTTNMAWFNALGIDNIATFDPRPVWAHNELSPHVRVPVGYDRDDLGSSVSVDLTAERSPRTSTSGLIQGNTGTGKSTIQGGLVLGLCARYSPSRINFILMDTAGAHTFRGLDKLPHVIGNFSFLWEHPDHVGRATDCVIDEIERRTAMLQQLGVIDVVDYRNKRAFDPARYPALPELIIMMNEAHEFIDEVRPEFPNFLTHVARVGSSVGVHLIMSSHSVKETTLADWLEYLTFGICLRVSTASASQVGLGFDDAVRLPLSFDALLRQGTSQSLVGFRTFHIDAPVPGLEAVGTSQRASLLGRLRAYTSDDLGERSLAEALAKIPSAPWPLQRPWTPSCAE